MSCAARRSRAVGPLPARLLVLVAVLAGGCRPAGPPDTPTVVLADGRAGDQPWRLEGRRTAGRPCLFLLVPGTDQPVDSHCGIRAADLRHLSPNLAVVGGRLLAFSAVAARARRVRLDGADGSITIVPARPARGFPARFFVADLDPGHPPLVVRVFAGGGRAVPT